MKIRLEPCDVWIGWFWDRRADGTHHYVCLIPCVVMHWVWGVRNRDSGHTASPARIRVAKTETVQYSADYDEQELAKRLELSSSPPLTTRELIAHIEQIQDDSLDLHDAVFSVGECTSSRWTATAIR